MKLKTINLALQGGGAHGAFAWGVLDRFLEEEALDICAISAASTGAINAVATCYGLAQGGRQKAREVLSDIWRKISLTTLFCPLQPTLIDKLLGPGNMDYNPYVLFFEILTRVYSPYVWNPMNINFLQNILNDTIDFKKLQSARSIQLFLSATNVRTGRNKVFTLPDISFDTILASTCLPFLFHAVEKDGDYYWDGGYTGNPPLYPLIHSTACPDIVIVQSIPIEKTDVPLAAGDIMDRTTDIAFNRSLMQEIRTVHLVNRLIAKGMDDDGRLKRINIHTINAGDALGSLTNRSAKNTSWDFLQYLHNTGYNQASIWIEHHYDSIGIASTCDVEGMFL